MEKQTTQEYEKAQETNIDKPAEQFGILLGLSLIHI